VFLFSFFLENATKLDRIQKQMSSNLSPQFTAKKVEENVATSRFGRPQKKVKEDDSLLPTDMMLYVSKYSPKRKKPKIRSDLSAEPKDIAAKEEEAVSQIDDSLVINMSTEETSKDSDEENKQHISNESKIKEEPQHPGKLVIEGVITNESICAMETDSVVPDDDDTKDEAHEEADSSCPKMEEETVPEPEIEATESPMSDIKTESMFDDYEETKEKQQQDFSDTDSALGSASSSKDEAGTQNHQSSNIFAGQILWGSFSKQSWFPCMAYPADENSTNVIVTGNCIILP